MVRIQLMDGSALEIQREEALELIPYSRLFSHPLLKHPVDALLAHRGQLIPVLGPLPSSGEEQKSVDERPWILLLKGCAQVIRGLPQFAEESSAQVVKLPSAEQSALLDELDSILKEGA